MCNLSTEVSLWWIKFDIFSPRRSFRQSTSLKATNNSNRNSYRRKKRDCSFEISGHEWALNTCRIHRCFFHLPFIFFPSLREFQFARIYLLIVLLFDGEKTSMVHFERIFSSGRVWEQQKLSKYCRFACFDGKNWSEKVLDG